MEIKFNSDMILDKHFFNLKKLSYKYSVKDVADMLAFADEILFEKVKLKDFNGNLIAFMPSKISISNKVYRKLLLPSTSTYSTKSMEDEIHSTFSIENINSSRDSVRKILRGLAPTNNQEEYIYAMKRALDFISDKENKITEENLFKLYNIAIVDFLDDEDKLLDENFYRHDKVYIVGDEIAHQGISHDLLPTYMKEFIEFINADDNINQLQKACIIHFYFAYLHPYFDGNGRTARLVHLWYLIQSGFSSTLFTSFSKYISLSKNDYYGAFTLVEENYKISKKIDLTPFLHYFSVNIYDKIEVENGDIKTFEIYEQNLKEGNVTEKETKLWSFVIANYGSDSFSTKQLEKDFSDVAYATIRKFVLKFKDLGLLKSQKFGNRLKYHIV
ncbi:MAG: Fic family protein [Clostridia bacterium]